MLWDKETQEKLAIGLKPDDSLDGISPKHAKRLALWRKYLDYLEKSDDTKALVITVTGIPSTGKTTLAHELATRLRIKTVMCGDWIREFIRTLLPPEESPALFKSVYDTWQFVAKEPTPEAIVEGYLRQAEPLRKGVEALVERCGKKGESGVIDYLHYLPLKKREGLVQVLLEVPAEVYEEKLRLRAASHRNDPVERLIEQKDKYLVMQEYMVKCASEAGTTVIKWERTIHDAVEPALDAVYKEIKRLVE